MPRKAPYGFQRVPLTVYIPLPAGTSAAELVTDLDLGFQFELESATVSTAIASTGSGATRTLRVLKGASTVAASGTVTLAGTSTLGEQTALTVTAANATFRDGDLLTVDFASGGTAFTAGAVNLVLVVRELPQRKV